MFLHRVHVEQLAVDGSASPVPLRQIDSFCMRNFTNDAIFDDTLPVSDGLLEVGTQVPLAALRDGMEAWFRRKGYLKPCETLRLRNAADGKIEAP